MGLLVAQTSCAPARFKCFDICYISEPVASRRYSIELSIDIPMKL